MEEQLVIDVVALKTLFDVLKADYILMGPTRQDGAIIYDELASPDDLPLGWTDAQEAGTYRIERRSDNAHFGYAVGPHTWKRVLFPPEQTLFKARLVDGHIQLDIHDPSAERPVALIGVRACELAAMAVQDQVFLGDFKDAGYAARRAAAFYVAVNCSTPAATCFCTSMSTGPECETGYDLALTEILEPEHSFLVEVGSERGRALIAKLERRPAEDADRARAEAVVEAARAGMGRIMPPGAEVRERLLAAVEDPHWESVAQRCLSCANCTMVCPTCFCSTVEDATDLTGGAERVRRWDSCFSLDFSYLHGGPVRRSTASRYRQWISHKLATWWTQFGTSGCVGCGRCITWCPVGIDLTAEVAALEMKHGD